jgi:RnfABCDGE-type electron transport complex B subunit
MNVILIAVIVLGAVGLVAAIVLFFVSKKFAVKEDPRIGAVQEVLPGANCGGCGFPGCGGMAGACVKAADNGSLEGLNCPVGGAETMSKIASILGMEVSASEPKVAVVRCNGNCENRPRVAVYDGLQTCKAVNSCGAGETACGYGCLGCGDCVAACQFDAIHINPETMLPEVDEEKCVACGACVKACPRNIIELRKKGVKGRRVWVDCVNKDKGPAAIKACKVSCIACGKCQTACKFDAITIENNVAYIDSDKCKICRACVKVCPRDAIETANFPTPVVKDKDKPKATAADKPANTAPAAKADTPAKPEVKVATPVKPEAKPEAAKAAKAETPAKPEAKAIDVEQKKKEGAE